MFRVTRLAVRLSELCFQGLGCRPHPLLPTLPASGLTISLMTLGPLRLLLLPRGEPPCDGRALGVNLGGQKGERLSSTWTPTLAPTSPGLLGVCTSPPSASVILSRSRRTWPGWMRHSRPARMQQAPDPRCDGAVRSDTRDTRDLHTRHVLSPPRRPLLLSLSLPYSSPSSTCAPPPRRCLSVSHPPARTRSLTLAALPKLVLVRKLPEEVPSPTPPPPRTRAFETRNGEERARARTPPALFFYFV